MRKYLNALGKKDSDLPWNWNKGDKRQEEWKKERKEYGFDERDTWNLNYSITILVYERLKYYREFAPVEMDKIDFSHTYEVDGEKMAYGTIVDRILKGFESYLGTDDIRFDEDVYKEYQECWKLLGIIMPSLWW